MHDNHGADDVFRRGAAVLGRLSSDGVKPPWESFADVAPVLGREVGHAFGAIIARPGLDLRTREIATVCMLAVLGGCEPQVAFHVGGALRAGATAAEVIEALTQVSVYAGVPRALNAVAATRQVFAEYGLDATVDAPRAVVVAFLDALTRGDLPAALELLAEDVTVSLPGIHDAAPWAGVWKGREGAGQLHTLLCATVEFDDLTVAHPIAHGATVYVPGSFACRDRAHHPGRSGEFVAAFQVNGGRITEVRGYGDA